MADVNIDPDDRDLRKRICIIYQGWRNFGMAIIPNIFPNIDLVDAAGLVLRVQETAVNSLPAGSDAQKGLYGVLLIILIPAAVVLLLLARLLYKHTIGKRMATTLKEDYQKEADGLERAGRFVSAALVYAQKLKQPRRAAELYERGGDLVRAAETYDMLGMSDKARELYQKAGSAADAAEVAIRDGDYEGAAKLYVEAGKKIDAAVLLERSGRKMAAVRAYREAGEYRHAARLLEAEGMLKEAAEMFGMSLGRPAPDSASMGSFLAYAVKLEQAGEPAKALEVYRSIDRIDPTYRDVRERINRLSSSPEAEDDLQGKTTLRSFIRSGRIEPRYGLKLWVQMLRTLQEGYKAGRPYGLCGPDNVVIDSQNNMSFLNRPLSAAYEPPEAGKDMTLDIRADIYSAGVILYELLTGGLEGLGSTRVMDVAEDVPEWLDEIVIRCIRKVRDDRYQTMEEIFADLKRLSQSKKG
jgi:tetratricopeptide (TPR) repeat protein